MNEETKMYIPYGAAAIGGGLGWWLYGKFPKFGMVGKLVAVGAGVAGGYYISKEIVKNIEKKYSKFSNLVDVYNSPMMPCKKFTCPKGFSYTEDKGCVNKLQSLNYIDCPKNHFWCPRRRVCCINPNK